MISNKEYSEKVGLAHRKKYAQFFTPEDISDFMAKWILSSNKCYADILDPAFGLGIFCRSLMKINKRIKVTGYDIDDIILNYAKKNFASQNDSVSICKQDYLESSWCKKYDGIICNPPYLKFHDYDNVRYISDVNSHLGTKLNGFTNIYTLFLLKSISQLKEGGRLAYIIPSEFLNSDYGVEVKKALIESGTLKHVIIVDFTECPFDDALTTASILFCEKSECEENVRFSIIKKISDLSSCFHNYKSYSLDHLDANVKWKQYYEQTSASNYQNLVPFKTFAKVTRGIATGANNYFTFNLSKLDDFNIEERYVLPCICHSQDVNTPIFTSDDFKLLAKGNKNVFLFNGCAAKDDLAVNHYIELGEQLEINKRYLTASRSPWYSIENRPPSPIWVSVFNRSGLRFVRNEANVHNLTTFHCVYNNEIIDTDVLFAYLVTSVAKQIFLDNSRQYGNGLIKFEPNDLNEGMVVDLTLLTSSESTFVKEIYNHLKVYPKAFEKLVTVLDSFFTKKYTGEDYDINILIAELYRIKAQEIEEKDIRVLPRQRVKQLNFFDVLLQYPESIVENNVVREDFEEYNSADEPHGYIVKAAKNVLVSLVKDDNIERYIDQSAKIYYTGKKFPSSVALNKLYYFMPYIKRKGIRDLYLIKIARIGTRKEGQPDNDPNDFRLVFEIEFVKKLFDDYKPFKLVIWHTFTDTTMAKILELR